MPSIFTDEPQFARKVTLPFADAAADAILPWTEDFEQTFRAAYGQEILDRLPELFWELPEERSPRPGTATTTTWRSGSPKPLPTTAGPVPAHGLNLTGHMMEEPTPPEPDRRPGRGHAGLPLLRPAGGGYAGQQL